MKSEFEIALPVYREHATIRTTLERIHTALVQCDRLPTVYRIVVDDLQDPSILEARAARTGNIAVEVSHNPEPGGGGAIRAALRNCHAPLCVITMGDGCDDPRDICQMVEYARRSEAGIVVGNRFAQGKSEYRGTGKVKSLLTKMVHAGSMALRTVPDPTNNFRLYNVQKCTWLNHSTTKGFEFSLESLRLARQNHQKIASIPAQWDDHNSPTSMRKIAAMVPVYMYQYARWLLGF